MLLICTVGKGGDAAVLWPPKVTVAMLKVKVPAAVPDDGLEGTVLPVPRQAVAELVLHAGDEVDVVHAVEQEIEDEVGPGPQLGEEVQAAVGVLGDGVGDVPEGRGGGEVHAVCALELAPATRGIGQLQEVGAAGRFIHPRHHVPMAHFRASWN